MLSKHYRAIALVLKLKRQQIRQAISLTYPTYADEFMDGIVNDLCTTFSEDDEQFNADKFRIAAWAPRITQAQQYKAWLAVQGAREEQEAIDDALQMEGS